MNMQDVASLVIPEGEVKSIHDKSNRLLWGKVSYSTKYVGKTTQDGTPTPDSPVAVNVVTGTQNVSVHGKNFLPLTDQSFNISQLYYSVKDGKLKMTGNRNSEVMRSSSQFRNNFSFILPAGTYVTNSRESGSKTGTINLYLMKKSDNSLISSIPKTGSNTFTIQDDTEVYLGIYSYQLTISNEVLYEIQIERGNVSTSWEPYQSHTYTVNLGSTELCGINAHQDYIHKSGNDWYVYKVIGKSALGILNWSYSDTGTANVYRMYTGGLSGQYVAPADNASVPEFVCTHFTPNNANANYGCTISIASNPSGSAVYCYDPDYNTISSPSDFKTWLSENSVNLYYVLKTPTDTKITDSTLISQLEAVNDWLTRYGYDATVSGNLPIVIDRTNL